MRKLTQTRRTLVARRSDSNCGCAPARVTSRPLTNRRSAQRSRCQLPIVDHGRSASLQVRSGMWCGPWDMTSMRRRHQYGRQVPDLGQHPERNPHSGTAGSAVKRRPGEGLAARSEVSGYTEASVPTPPRSANSMPPARRSAPRGCSSSSTRPRSSGPCTRTRTPRGWGGWCRRSPGS